MAECSEANSAKLSFPLKLIIKDIFGLVASRRAFIFASFSNF
jgi:hypothetical protein